MVVRNNDLYQLCRNFFKASLSSLNSYLKQVEEPNYKCIDEAHFFEDGRIGIESRHLPDWGILIANSQNEIKALLEFSSLRTYVAETELKKKFLVDYHGKVISSQVYDHWLWQFTFVPLISKYLSTVHGLDYNEVVFNELYTGIEEFCYSPTMLLIYVAPLFYFDIKADADNIPLDSDLIIRKLTAQERSRLWSLASDIPLLSRQDTYNLRFAAYVTRQTSKRNPSYNPHEYFIALEALLRLITRQPITINFVLSYPEPWFDNKGSGLGLSSWSKTRQQRLMPQFPRVTFNSGNIESLRRLWKGYTEIKNNSRFALALNRFSSAYDEANLEDKLLDLWIGCETLYSQRIQQELGYRIALRMAYFLGKTHKSRGRIFRRAKESYKRRSAIVHGNKGKGDLSTITKRTENFLAASLKSCLSHRKVLSEEDLENKILKGA